MGTAHLSNMGLTLLAPTLIMGAAHLSNMELYLTANHPSGNHTDADLPQVEGTLTSTPQTRRVHLAPSQHGTGTVHTVHYYLTIPTG